MVAVVAVVVVAAGSGRGCMNNKSSSKGRNDILTRISRIAIKNKKSSRSSHNISAGERFAGVFINSM